MYTNIQKRRISEINRRAGGGARAVQNGRDSNWKMASARGKIQEYIYIPTSVHINISITSRVEEERERSIVPHDHSSATISLSRLRFIFGLGRK